MKFQFFDRLERIERGAQAAEESLRRFELKTRTEIDILRSGLRSYQSEAKAIRAELGKLITNNDSELADDVALGI